jgi:hypothetical protein
MSHAAQVACRRAVHFQIALLALLAGADPNLLRGAHSGADARLTDGQLAPDGADWLSAPAVTLRAESWPQWDLGSSRLVTGAALQADNNDGYVVSLSEDGSSWTDVFQAAPVAESGQRFRSITFTARGRYVRLRAEGGDSQYSVSELQLFDGPLDYWTSDLIRPRFLREPLAVAWAALLVAVAIALTVLTERTARWRALLVTAALGLMIAWTLRATFLSAALSPSLLSWIRCTVALSALLAVARTAVFRNRAPSRASLVDGVLAVTGVLGVLCFVNFARPQFFDAGRNAPTFLHDYDMRVYYPIAKYFPELRFDGVYAASAAAMQEELGRSPDLLSHTMTNLRTRQTQKIGDSQQYLAEVRARFTPARWAEFVTDIRYFRRAMGDYNFLGSMSDNGGNATPVWFLGAKLVFGSAPASDFALWAGVVVDALLLLLAFAALAWAYGLRSALIAMTVFGAMDFYMFGSNWFGSPLRHDWISLWCIGVALLKKERFFLGGGLLTWAALIRVFPMLSLLTITAPVGWALAGELLRRRFSPRKFLASHRDFLRVVLGALAFGSVLLLLSVLSFGAAAWLDWASKISMMTGSGLNTVGLSCVLEGPWLVAGRVVALLAILFALRKAPLEEAAAFGPALVGVVLNPMNYYLHCLFLLAVLGSERRLVPWLAVLGMSAGCYLTTFDDDLWIHFRYEAWAMLAAVGLLVIWRFGLSLGSLRLPAAVKRTEPQSGSIAASG